MKLGIAGFMGSGKSTAALFLAQTFGWYLIDADREAKVVMESSLSIQQGLSDTFGVVSNNQIDYLALGRIVFSNREQLLRLNSLVHPPLKDHLETLQQEALSQGKTVLIDGALLPLWDESNLIDKGLWITAGESLRIERVAQRSGLSLGAVEERVVRQYEILLSPEDLRWQSVENSGSLEELQQKVYQWGAQFE